MATGLEEKVGYRLVRVGTVTLENADEDTRYISIVVCQDKIIVLDENTYKVSIHGLHDGKFLASSDRLESGPRDMCLMDAMTICVLHDGGLIKIVSIDSTDMSRDIKTTKTLRLQGVLLDRYDDVVRFKDSLVVTGVKQGMMYWCIVSLQDGHVDTIHQICKGDGWCRVTTKDNMIYISCYAGVESPDNTGVYGFDILNPSQCKYKYKHPCLQWPSSIVINEDGTIFVCNYGYLDYSCIHQLKASCQLVAIFPHGIPSQLYSMFWNNGRLYGTCDWSPDITVFSHVYQGSHKASEVPVSDERKPPVIEETTIQIGQGNVDQGQSSVSTEMLPSGPVPEDSEDDKQGPIIPVEILRMDDKSLQLYKKALQEGKEKVYNIRVMVVGQFGVGKTTLTKRLLGKEVDISERQSTEGIDVYKHCCEISLDTGEWIVQYGDTEQDHQLQRIARVLIEKQSVSDRFPDKKEVAIPSQGERTSAGDASVNEEQEGRSPESNASVTDKEQVKLDPGNEMLIPGSNANVTADVQVIIPPQGEINRDSNKNVTDKENGNMDPVRVMGIPDTNANVAENRQVIIPPHGGISPDSNAYVADKEEVKDPMKEMLKLLRENANQLKQDKGKVSPLSVWDFAGQYAFYTTHQTFLTRRAIYLLVSDVSGQITDLVDDECFLDSEGIRKCRVHELTDIWLNSIHSCAASSEDGIPPVILVGTHVDKITQKQLRAKVIELETQRMTPAREQFTLPTTSLSDAVSTKEQASASTIFQSVQKYFKPRKTKGNVEATPVTSMTDQPKKKKKWRFWKRTRKERFDADTDKSYHYELCERYFREVRSYLRDKPTRLHLVDEDFAIDNTILDRKLEDLKRKIIEVAFQQPYWGEEIPARWLPLEQELMKLKAAGIKVIPLTVLEDLNKAGAVQIATDELGLFLRFHHDIGTILYFSLEILKKRIVLDPQWMINALKSLITAEMFVLKSALAIAGKWYEFKQKGKLYPELIDAVWSKKNNPDFHDNKEHILLLMEQLNIIAKPRYYSEDGSEVKVESYFLAPCMLSERTPTEVISLAQHPERNSSSVLCYVFQGKFLPAPIFHRLLATCVGHWPIAKKMSENLIFCGCCVFNIDLHHSLTMFFRDYVIFAQVTRMGATEKNPSFELCIDVQKFITMTLSSIIGHLRQNLRFDLFIQCPRIDGYRVDCLIPVADLKENEDVPCHFHEISHVIISMDVIKFWFQEMEQSADGWMYKNLGLQDVTQVSQAGKMKSDIDRTEAVFVLDQLVQCAKSVGIIRSPGTSGTGFRVGPNYIMTAKHVVDKIIQGAPVPLHQQQQQLHPLGNTNVYIDFSYERDGVLSDENLKFYFEPELVYASDELDTVILKLKPDTKTFPPPLIHFHNFIQLPMGRSGYLIGHSRADIKKTDKYSFVMLTEPDINDRKKWSMSYVNVDGYAGIEDTHRVLFHCSFEKGASGAPGFWICPSDGQAYVELMLLCGYPTWYYDDNFKDKTVGIPNSYLIEQGVSMKSVFDAVQESDASLCKTIFPRDNWDEEMAPMD